MASGGNSASSYRQRVIRGSGDGSTSSVSGGPKFGIARGKNPRCHCGAYAIVVESRTDKNPRRPFFGCPYYRVRNIGYGIFFMHCKIHRLTLILCIFPFNVGESFTL
ncbi:uncharacterized protein DS421_17g601150 [Arachis hypogaea]|nr:uncharacterized protein DS421_17g601150 [Arachis hypogaea]